LKSAAKTFSVFLSLQRGTIKSRGYTLQFLCRCYAEFLETSVGVQVLSSHFLYLVAPQMTTSHRRQNQMQPLPDLQKKIFISTL